MKALKTKVTKVLKNLEDRAQKVYGSDFKLREYSVEYTLNSIRTTGKVSYKNGKVTMILHPDLLKEFGDVYIQRTVIHEFAHIVTRSLYPSGFRGYKKVHSHGHEFKSVCKYLGYPQVGKATTDVYAGSKTTSTPERKQMNTFTYTCACDTHEISAIRHRRAQRGTSYTCRSCKTQIKPKGIRKYEVA